MAVLLASQQTEKASTKYTWPASLDNVDMTSRDKPAHTTLLPDKDTAHHPEVQKALMSLVLGCMVEQDKSDIMAGISLPIISNLMLPSLVPLNKEESLLFSHIKPLQGDALMRAARIMKTDVSPPKSKGKRKAKSVKWTIPIPTENSTTPPTQEPQWDVQSTSDTYEDLPLSQSLWQMTRVFPTVSEEHLMVALEKHNNNLPTALAWIQSVVDMRDMQQTLIGAFPTALEDEIGDAIREFSGNFILAFSRLQCTHDPTDEWDNIFFIQR